MAQVTKYNTNTNRNETFEEGRAHDADASLATSKSASEITKAGLGSRAAAAPDDDPEPDSKDYSSIGEWSKAKMAWRARKAAKNPQAGAVSKMLGDRAK
jgi:hypothetical protein